VDPHGEAMKQHEAILKSTLAAALKEHCGWNNRCWKSSNPKLNFKDLRTQPPR
jgi:hypothetical protein